MQLLRGQLLLILVGTVDHMLIGDTLFNRSPCFWTWRYSEHNVTEGSVGYSEPWPDTCYT